MPTNQREIFFSVKPPKRKKKNRVTGKTEPPSESEDFRFPSSGKIVGILCVFKDFATQRGSEKANGCGGYVFGGDPNKKAKA